ncbi:hypothetical protein [Roseiterribacter gracilis]|uniref:Uncharacterized protein n=1 Tax=Roseiterribacter gracilis TaxID=2812848 RepID=A0A8S8X8I8_9PROT|nr:hypothetical protein TMPK1_12210 [Rhodospirillales bacterium TMPK1]
MSIQPLLPTAYMSLAQSLQKNATSTDATDPLGILSGSADATSSSDPIDLLFGDSTDSSSSSLASFLGSSGDTQSVFDSFTDEAKAVLLQAQEEAQKQTSADGTTNAAGAADAATTTVSNNTANDPLVQALAALLSPSAQAVSWL